MKNTIYIILSFFFLISCKNEPTPQLPLNTALELYPLSNNIPADNYTYVKIIAHIDSSLLNTANRNVTFNTNLGVFGGSGTSYSTAFGDSGNAICYLKSNTIGIATITANIGSNLLINSTTISFTTAYPDSVYLALSSPTMKANSSSTETITASLLRTKGAPTNNIFVAFSAINNIGKGIGTFYNIQPNNITSSPSAMFSLQADSTYTGYIKFKVRLSNGLTDSNSVLVIP
jgi:hypothetical protein